MKYSFNFLQVANWLIVCRKNIKKIENNLIEQKISEEDLLLLLQTEKRKISILKDILHRKVRLHGVSKDFLSDLKEIKKQYGIEN